MLNVLRQVGALVAGRMTGLPCHVCGIRTYHMSPVAYAGQQWRKERGLHANPTSGPLSQGPDYSFIDGRPTPAGTGKIKRAEKQLKLSKKIIELTKEVEFAVENHDQRLQMEEDRKNRIISRKLKPKASNDAE